MTTLDRAVAGSLLLALAVSAAVPLADPMRPYLGPAMCLAAGGWFVWWRVRVGSEGAHTRKIHRGVSWLSLIRHVYCIAW